MATEPLTRERLDLLASCVGYADHDKDRYVIPLPFKKPYSAYVLSMRNILNSLGQKDHSCILSRRAFKEQLDRINNT